MSQEQVNCGIEKNYLLMERKICAGFAQSGQFLICWREK
jgi:hypothetical protein